MDAAFVRYQATELSRRGNRVGIFGLANSLAAEGKLSGEDHEWLASANAWYNAAYPNPTAADPNVYDRDLHPHAQAWFKRTAVHLLARVPGYLALLTRYGVQWEEVRSAHPGTVIYEDDAQIVVDPSTGTPSRPGI